MYVSSRSIPEPPMSGFGAYGSDPELSEGNPFDDPSRGGDSGGDIGDMALTAASALLPCLAASDKAGCAWDALLGLIMAQPDVEDILTKVATMDCRTALTALGLGSTAVSLACGFGGPFWRSVQAKAQQKLADLGFTPATPPPGESICPPHAEVVARDAAGNPTVLQIVTNTPVGADGSCPPGVPPVPGAAPPVAAPLPGDTPPSTPTPTQLIALRRREVSTKTLQTIPPGRVTGRVVDASGNGIAYAEVKVGSLSNRVTGKTDATGAFSVSAGATSRQRLFISAKGYEGAQVDGLSVTSGATVDVGAIPLVAISAAGPKTEPGAGGTAGPWYTSTWFIVGGLVVAGGAGYLIYRSRKGK